MTVNKHVSGLAEAGGAKSMSQTLAFGSSAADIEIPICTRTFHSQKIEPGVGWYELLATDELFELQKLAVNPRDVLGVEHFRREHFLCGHSQCLEQKFVVFASEQELKQHNAREHAGTMTRAERRQAMTIPIDIQVPNLPPFLLQDPMYFLNEFLELLRPEPRA